MVDVGRRRLEEETRQIIPGAASVCAERRRLRIPLPESDARIDKLGWLRFKREVWDVNIGRSQGSQEDEHPREKGNYRPPCQPPGSIESIHKFLAVAKMRNSACDGFMRPL